MKLDARIRDLVEKELEGSEYFLVDVKGGDKSRKISVLIDGDLGITVEKCSLISRRISKVIDEDSFEADSFILEVSSPGTDNPLVSPRQYGKHKGRLLDVIKMSGELITGKLTDISPKRIVLAPAERNVKNKPGKIGRNKIKVDMTALVEIPFMDIETSTVVLSFNQKIV